MKDEEVKRTARSEAKGLNMLELDTILANFERNPFVEWPRFWTNLCPQGPKQSSLVVRNPDH